MVFEMEGSNIYERPEPDISYSVDCDRECLSTNAHNRELCIALEAGIRGAGMHKACTLNISPVPVLLG